MSDNLEKLKFPIGKYQAPLSIDQSQISIWIDEIRALPQMLIEACAHLNDEQLNTRYREAGWTLRQVVHHIGESHMNSFIRFKWALTEKNPRIRTYHEDRWAELTDAKDAPIDISLDFISALHRKWTYMLDSLSFDDFSHSMHHPEMKRDITLGWTLGLYAWHGEHHLQHIKQTARQHNW